ncbi:MAG: group III truncated hemoglobin [Cyclobacteriaceae bacterium]|jgi:hemoglobin|nr:group III truncated hemoglobin [Cyclobacteriaceae bacterium]
MRIIKTDIVTREDIQYLVNSFYTKVRADELLAPLFSAVDWPHHLPVMYNFWSSVLLGDQSYAGNPMSKHLHLPLEKHHFTRWLLLFTATVDENFEGYNATEAKNRARLVADLFQFKMGLIR